MAPLESVAVPRDVCRRCALNQSQWKKVDELFAAALELDPTDRATLLERECADDATLRAEVETLLQVDAAAGDFLERPAFNDAVTILTEKTASHVSTGSIDDARFVPGEILAERYRIVGLLGRGGMGEVYRADDLKLRQAVALKFLSEPLSSDGSALARFYREVSTARQISHRHVCRVYDVGEYAGLHFLSMEFVRGEELTSLLKRIGRLPQDKAVDIARQICGGLAAIHEQGVLHRDLKPANLMIDEHGDVRITDFGIAALTGSVSGREAMVGTPAYMAPEQIEGGEVTTRSDIYALGLVLYELFTGHRAFDAPNLGDLIRLRRSGTLPERPTGRIPDLDPRIERVILQCLAPEPEVRPSSALQIAAALPGGDPLAAALAAGETPSPEMVAGAFRAGTLRPPVAMLLLVIVVAGMIAISFFADRVLLHQVVPLERSPGDLARHATELARTFGYTAKPADSVERFDLDHEALAWIREHDASPERWEKLRSGRPSPVVFWHRTSPRSLDPFNASRVQWFDPPMDTAGMVRMQLDPAGRLLSFEAVPPQVENAARPAPANWTKLFEAAGLRIADFRETPSQWTPPQHSDTRAAWSGTWPGRPELPLRIEAASYRGRPVYFELISPWSIPVRDRLPDQTRAIVFTTLLYSAFFGALALTAFLAWLNVRRGRGDRRGAIRIVVFLFCVRIIHWIFATHHVASFGEVSSFIRGLQSALYLSCALGLMYLALEPFVRRRWPDWVISWSRLLAGRFRDALVGRDVLIGAGLGIALILTSYLPRVLASMLGRPLSQPAINSPLIYDTGLGGLNGFVALVSNQTLASLMFTLVIVAVVLFFQLVLRRTALALGASWLIFFAIAFANAGDSSMRFVVGAMMVPTIFLVALARFGLLALVTTIFYLHLWTFYPVTSDLSAWFAPNFILQVILLTAITVYGFVVSLEGQRILSGGFLEDAA
jgi:hypothetical protein